MRQVTINELASNLDQYAGSYVHTTGRVQQIVGRRLLILRDPKVARSIVLVTLENPDLPAQQATYSVGDRVEVSGQALRYNRAEVEKRIAGDLGGFDLSSYQGGPTIVATALTSVPRVASPVPAPSPRATGATTGAIPPAGTPSPRATGVTTQSMPAARPEASPDLATPSLRSPPQSEVVGTAPFPGSPQAPALVADARVIRLNPALYSGQTIEMVGTVAAAYGTGAFRLDTAPGTDLAGSQLLIIGGIDGRVPAAGTRVRLTGVVYRYAPNVIERQTGLAPSSQSLGDLIGVPFIVASRITPLAR
jgi:hypothetical protein